MLQNTENLCFKNELRYCTRYLQAQVFEKLWGSGAEGKVPHSSDEHLFLSSFFFEKISIFVTFKGNYTIRFSKRFEKRKYHRLSWENFKFSKFFPS